MKVYIEGKKANTSNWSFLVSRHRSLPPTGDASATGEKLMVWLSTVKKINFCDHVCVDCTLNSRGILADFVAVLSIAASTDKVNKRLVVTDDDQLKVFLVLTAVTEIAKTSKPSLISDLYKKYT